MNYSECLQKLVALNYNRGMKLGLDNPLKLSHALSDPHKAYPSIHIAGTNGKGSVSTKIAAALQAAGKRVGLYTSPHIACFRERIRIDGIMIPEADAEKILRRIFTIIESQNIPATFFEVTTLLAFQYFAEQAVDMAVIETGLGGRFDATNIITPILSVITSISLEHTDILGSTIESIAKEKAGIIKRGVPLVIGPNTPTRFFLQIAQESGSPCHITEPTCTDYHEENEAVAKKALQCLKTDDVAIAAGLKALPPCRLESFYTVEGATVILDVAHNPNGFQCLLQALQRRHPGCKPNFIIGMSSNKDIEGCLMPLKKAVKHMYLIEADSPRAVPKELLLALCKTIGIEAASTHQTVKDALTSATASGPITVVCGTFFIMNAARQALGLCEPQDPVNLNEAINRLQCRID